MVNPGTFLGTRKEFLELQKEDYGKAVSNSCVNDALAVIYRKYFKRYPIELSLKEEPSPEHTAAVSDNQPDKDVEIPDEESLTTEEYEKAIQDLKDRSLLIEVRKKQIRSWLSYQYMKDHSNDVNHPDNPFHLLLNQLNNQTKSRPRVPIPWNVWRKDSKAAIEKEAHRRADLQGVPLKNLAPVREKVVREMYNALSQEHKDKWEERAKSQHTKAVKKWEAESKEPPSTAPRDRQLCINSLSGFVQPILDGIAQRTGWKCTVIMGGPEPAQAGRLTMLSVHSGTTPGDVKMNFGRSQHVMYEKYICGTFGNFLRQCYSPDDCRASSLDKDDDLNQLLDFALDAGDVHTFDLDPGSPSGTPAPPLTNLDQEESMLPSTRETVGLTSNVSLPYSRHSTPASLPPSRAQSPAFAVPLAAPTTPAFAVPLAAPTTPALAVPLAAPTTPARAVPLAAPTTPALAVPLPPAAPTVPALAVPLPPAAPTAPALAVPLPPAAPTAPALAVPLSPLPPASTTLPSPTPPPPAPSVLVSAAAVPKKRKAGELEDPAAASGRIKAKRSTPNDGNVPLRPKRSRKPSAKVSEMSQNASEIAPPPKTPPIVDLEKPKWFVQSLRMFQSEKLGVKWEELLDAWVIFEEKFNYTQITPLPVAGRPSTIAGWITARRSPTWRPVASNAKTLRLEFQSWWHSLQPEWRLDGDQVKDSVDGNLEVLRRSGLNGLNSLMAGLFFWGITAQRGLARKAFLEQLDDCLAVMSVLSQ